MMPMLNATLEQVSIVENRTLDTNLPRASFAGVEFPPPNPALAPRPPSRAELLREKLARYLAGDAPPSNFEAMVRVLERDPNAGAEPCSDCDGQGFRQLAPHVVAELDQKLENQLTEIARLEALLAKEQADAAKPPSGTTNEDIELEDRHRRAAAREVAELTRKLVEKHDAIARDKRERVKRTICRTCKGSAKARRRRRQGERPGRPDSMFSTVTCPGCTGRDARRHGKLMTAHTGTGCGQAKLRGPSHYEYSPGEPDAYTVVSDPRDDRAAERGDVCERCVGEDGLGTGYVVPITCRPTLRTNEVEEDLEQQQVRTVEVDGVRDEIREFEGQDGERHTELERFPAGDFGDVAPEAGSAEAWLDELAAQDPVLAAAVALYVGPQGDRWAQHESRWGRRFALWPLTDAGKKLASEAPGVEGHGGYERALAACVALRAAVEQSATKDLRRAALVAQAHRQALQLERRVEGRLAA